MPLSLKTVEVQIKGDSEIRPVDLVSRPGLVWSGLVWSVDLVQVY